MKLENDLVREILLAIEASNAIPLGWLNLELADRDPQVVSYHVQLLAEAGLIEAKNLTNNSGYKWSPTRLTYRGHEFLDTVRDPEVWRKTKDGAAKAGGAGLQLIWEIGKAVARQALKERTGIELDI